MVDNLLKVWPFSWISIKNACDQVTSSVSDRNMFWKAVLILSDSAVRCFHVGRFERRLPYYKCVYNDS